MKIQASKQINAPIDLTFDAFSDVQKIEERIDGIQAVEILSEIRSGIGTRWRETRVMFGQEATEEMEISAMTENRSYEVIAASRGMEYHTLYTFEERDGGTWVEMIFSGKAISLGAKLMTPIGMLFSGSMRKALEADMHDLKAFCESQVVA